MRISELLNPERVVLGFEARDRWEAIRRLVDRLILAGAIPAGARAATIAALEARERVASTGLEHGVAIPHATVDALDAAAAAVAISPKGVPFESLDGAPATIIVLLVIPRRGLAQHMRALPAIARLMDSPEVRSRLRGAQTAQQVIEVVRAAEERPSS